MGFNFQFAAFHVNNRHVICPDSYLKGEGEAQSLSEDVIWHPLVLSIGELISNALFLKFLLSELSIGILFLLRYK